MRTFLVGSSILALVACGKPTEATAPDELVEVEIAREDNTPAPAEPAPVPSAPVVPTLTLNWVADGFDAPEGPVQLDDGTFLISNVNGGGSDRDGNGYISHLGADGTVIEKKWFDGLDAPKGMTIHDDILYVTDIDRVHRIDLISKEPLEAVYIENAEFLNDATVWQGSVYVSDSRAAKIIRLGHTDTEISLEGEQLAGVNGLLGDGDRMLVSTMASGSLFEMRADGTVTELASGMANADGIGLVSSGGYLLSAWPGEIFYADDTGSVKVLVDTQEEGIRQNDLSVFGSTVIVPNWQPGTVTSWTMNNQ